MKTNIIVQVLSLALIIAMFGLFVQVYSTSKAQGEVKMYKAKCDSLQHASDSLHHLSDSLYYEIVPIQVELSRYYVAYGILLDRNPKAAKQLGDIISDETE